MLAPTAGTASSLPQPKQNKKYHLEQSFAFQQQAIVPGPASEPFIVYGRAVPAAILGLLPPQEPHTFDSFEPADSRLYGGTHFTFHHDDGQVSGHCIGQAIIDRVRFKSNKNEDIK